MTILEGSLDEQQAGFRPGRSCIDKIFTIRRAQERRIRYGKKVIMTFVDFVAAFDSVHRPSLWKAVSGAGVPPKIVRILESLYAKANSVVKVEDTLSPAFQINAGVR